MGLILNANEGRRVIVSGEPDDDGFRSVADDQRAAQLIRIFDVREGCGGTETNAGEIEGVASPKAGYRSREIVAFIERQRLCGAVGEADIDT